MYIMGDSVVFTLIVHGYDGRIVYQHILVVLSLR